MNRFPFKILFISIFLPPICYILSLQVLEGYFTQRETARLNHILIQNYDALYEGRYTLKEEIGRNISEYLRKSLNYKLGLRLQVMVKSQDDRILYPAEIPREGKGNETDGDFSSLPANVLNYTEVAADNYKTLNEGLVLSVNVQIKHNTWLANSILVFYVFLFVLILKIFIQRGIRESERQEEEQRQLLEKLSEQLGRAESGLKEVKAKESDYLKKIADLKEEFQEQSQDIDGLLDDLAKMEAGLSAQKGLEEEKELEILKLGEELDRLRERHQKPKKKKMLEATGKRFRVLYKNLTFTDRAIEGFLDLTEEFQLKAEEIIHKLNEDPSQVPVKRKVFGKGGKMNILEVDFSYSGRAYFQKDSQQKTRILAIGTKNTQDQDLTFIEKMK